MKTKFKTILKFTFFICSLSQVEAQNIGINGTGAVAHTSALLDVDNAGGAPRGILIPRVALNATTDGTTIATPAVSLMV